MESLKFCLINQQIDENLFNDLNQKYSFVSQESADFALIIFNNCIELQNLHLPKTKGIFVDFLSGKLFKRGNLAQNKNELIAKAIGIKNNYYPFVIDATAGLGRDSFILSSLGCRVLMIERNPIVYFLLENGLNRAYLDHNKGDFFKQNLQLVQNQSADFLEKMDLNPDVIYLDPMFPERNKSALVKKEMQFFHQIVGKDEDSKELLYLARKKATKRIVVKRPKSADYLTNEKPHFFIKGKNNRFDIYLPT